MKNIRFLIALGVSLGIAPQVYAVCNAGANCELPVTNNSAASWTASASAMTGIQNLNSVGPSGNDAGSRYYFAASGTDLGATVANGGITTTGDGSRVIGSFALNSSGTPGSTVTGGVVNSLLGGQTYFIYVQACPSGALLDSARCSLWARIGSKSTLAYPLSAFSAAVAPTDADTDSINIRTLVPTADIGNISQIQLTIDNMLGGTDQNNILLAWAGNATYTIDNTLYTAGGGFGPNTKYQYVGKVFYPYGVAVPTAGGTQVRGPFWTTPVNPSNISVSNVTHCSADITARNSAGSPANPTYTNYRLCATATCAAAAAIGGTASPTDTLTRTISGLIPGTTYTPNAQALVGNGDGTQTGWNSSAVINGGTFTTDGTNGTFTISNVTTTSADFNFPAGFDVSGAVSWQRRINGALSGPVVAGLPPSTIAFTGLTPNTAYTVQVTVNEASCNYTVPPTALAFTTTPNVPLTFDVNATGPRQLSATWAANGNPGATTYQIQYCTDAAFTVGCLTQTTAAGATSATLTTGVVPETTYFAHVRALTVGGGLNSAYSNSDSATTPNEAPTVNTASCSTPAGVPTTSTCTGTMQDNGPVSELRCNWSMQSGPGAVSFAPSTAQTPTGTPTSSTCPDVVATFPVNGAYVLTLTAKDANGTGLTGTRNVNVNVGQTPTSISISPNGATVVTGNSQVFNATVRDQFNAIIAGQTVNWTISGGGSLTPASGASTTFNATAPGGPFTLTAALGGVPSSTAAVTVVAAGPFFDTPPNLTVNPNNLTGVLTALGDDNVFGEPSLIYTWSVDSPAGASVSISPNGTNAAKNATVTFTAAGDYVFRCTISNTLSNSALTPMRTVLQVLSGIVVTPNNITINVRSNQAFAASGRDQFNTPMALTSVVWDTTTGFSVSGAGVFTAGTIGSNIRVVARQGAITGFAVVNAVDFDVTAAKAYPVPYKSTMGGVIRFANLGSEAEIRIYTTSGRLVFSTRVLGATYDWNVRNNSGESIASGVYLYVIESPSTKKNGKLIIIQ